MVVVDLMPSTIEQPNRGLSVFAAHIISKGDTIGAFCGSVLYTYLFNQLLSMKEYGEGPMTILESTLSPMTITLPNKAADCRGVEHSCWIVAAAFCMMKLNHRAKLLSETLRLLLSNICRHVGTTSFSGPTIHHLLALISRTFELSLWWQKAKFCRGRALRRVWW